MATVKDNLIAAKALIDTPDKWIKGSFEQNGCFCVAGALGMAEAGSSTMFSSKILKLVASFLPRGAISSVAAFNDDPQTTHTDIMALFDRAIAAQDAGET